MKYWLTARASTQRLKVPSNYKINQTSTLSYNRYQLPALEPLDVNKERNCRLHIQEQVDGIHQRKHYSGNHSVIANSGCCLAYCNFVQFSRCNEDRCTDTMERERTRRKRWAVCNRLEHFICSELEAACMNYFYRRR